MILLCYLFKFSHRTFNRSQLTFSLLLLYFSGSFPPARTPCTGVRFLWFVEFILYSYRVLLMHALALRLFIRNYAETLYISTVPKGIPHRARSSFYNFSNVVFCYFTFFCFSRSLNRINIQTYTCIKEPRSVDVCVLRKSL